MAPRHGTPRGLIGLGLRAVAAPTFPGSFPTDGIDSGRRGGICCRLDCREPLPGAVELTKDAVFGLVAQWRVQSADQIGEDRYQRGVFAGEPIQPRPRGVDQPYAVVSEVRGLDDPGPW